MTSLEVGSINSKSTGQFDDFQIYTGTSQVVAGMNYIIKIKVAADKFIQVKVFQSLPPVTYQLTSVEFNV